jgi:hypothetical protein
LSREQVTILTGAGVVLAAGTVLGKITATGKYAVYDDDNVDGTEVAAAILLYAVDATAADVIASVAFRLAEIKADKIVWAARLTTWATKPPALLIWPPNSLLFGKRVVSD